MYVINNKYIKIFHKGIVKYSVFSKKENQKRKYITERMNENDLKHTDLVNDSNISQ